jgi:ketosteroid isomerase-like protein
MQDKIPADTPSDQTIVNLRDAINSHDPDRIAGSFTEDFRCDLPMHPSRSFTGNDQVRANWTLMLARVPDIQAEIQRATHDTGSGETWSEWELTGTTADGNPITFRGVVISAARDGKMAWNHFYLDEVADV